MNTKMRFVVLLSLVIICLLVPLVCAQQRDSTGTYVFLTDQSTVVQTGGFAGVHETYPIQGQFQLTVDASAGVASFDDVNAFLLSPISSSPPIKLGELFNMTELESTVVNEALIEFRGKTADGTNTDVALKLTLSDDAVQLTGQTIPPPNTADFFIFNVDAVAQMKYSGGTGEPNDPYQIATAADLIALGETPEDYDKHFILTADIDLDPNLPGRKIFDKAVIAPDTDPNDYWGNFQGTPFTGVFDGDGRTISHLTIQGKDYLGLFGQLWPRAEVKDLGVVDVNAMGSGDCIGGLVGMNGGSVTKCHSNGAVDGNAGVGGLIGGNYGGSMTDCYSTAVVGGGQGVGGLAGWNGGTVTQCYSTGAVDGNAGVGGLIGVNWGTLTDCYGTGAVGGSDGVGGLVGYNEGSGMIEAPDGVVTRCYSIGAVHGESCVGGLVGLNQIAVLACFWDTETSHRTDSAAGMGKTTLEMQDANTYIDAGWDWVGERSNGTHEIWQIPPQSGYPVLTVFGGYDPPRLQGLGTPEEPYLIQNAWELGAVVRYSPRAHYRLAASIDLAGIGWVTPIIPAFAGTFDGAGLTISHLTIKGERSLGLFGELAAEAEVRNLGVEDANIASSASVAAGWAAGSSAAVGAVAGRNWGRVRHCYSTGVVSNTDVLPLEGYAVGGLVGDNNGRVTDCCSTSSVSGTDRVGGMVGANSGDLVRCHSASSVSGRWEVGGIVGENWGTVTDCYNTGTIHANKGYVGGLVGFNNDTVTHCYSNGAVSGVTRVGGLVGSNENGSIASSYSSGEVNGTGAVGGLLGNNSGTLAQCYSTGGVSGSEDQIGGLVGCNEYGSTLTQCYSTGAVIGAGNSIGGLVGYDYSLTYKQGEVVAACFWDTQTSGKGTSAGGTGKTTAEMQDILTFLEAGWDFVDETANGTDNIWWIDEGRDYPRLWWESDEASQF